MHEKQILMQEWICMKCPRTSNVEGDQYFNSQHAWVCWDVLARGIIFFKLLDWRSNVHFPWPNELTICPDIPVKSSRPGHRWCKTKEFFVFCSGKICLVCFQAFLFFCFMSSVSDTQNKCPNSHHNHPIHLFNTWIYRECKVPNGWICLSFDFLIQYSANGICLTSVNMQEYVTSLWLLWKSYIFPDLYWTSMTWPLRGKINFPGMVAHVTQ